jgi:hypothetical protein
VIGNVLVNANVAQGNDAKAKEEARCCYLPAIARLANERQLAGGRQRASVTLVAMRAMMKLTLGLHCAGAKVDWERLVLLFQLQQSV